MRSKVTHLPNEILYQDSNDQNQLFPRLQRKDQGKIQIDSKEREQSSMNCLLISLKALNLGLFTSTRPSEKAAVRSKKGQDTEDGVLWWTATPQWQFAAIILDSSDYSACLHSGSLSSERRLYKEGCIQTCLLKKLELRPHEDRLWLAGDSPNFLPEEGVLLRYHFVIYILKFLESTKPFWCGFLPHL